MNRSRVLKMILAVLALALAAWIASHTYWDYAEVPMPLKGEAFRDPKYAARQFATKLGARVVDDPGMPSAEAVIVLSDWHWDLSEERRERLETWVESGGRLVVDDTLLTGGTAFEEWTGIERLLPPEEETEDEESEEESEEAAENEAAAFEVDGSPLAALRCRTLKESPESVQSYELCYGYPSSLLVSRRKIAWALSDSWGMQVARVNVGRGSVTVVNASPFDYRLFLDGNHAALFAAVTQLRGGDEIRFLKEEEHSSLLALAWRTGAPVVVLGLLGIALALWRGAIRFGPLAAAPDAARRSLAEQIRSTGQFALRFGEGRALHAAAARALQEAAVRRIPAYDRLPTEERMAALAAVTGYQRDALAAAIHYTGARRSNELRSAIALLEAARRRIVRGTTGLRHGN